MNTEIKLLPSYFKITGWILLVISIIVLILFLVLGIDETEYNWILTTNKLICLLALTFVSFSRMRNETPEIVSKRKTYLVRALIFGSGITIIELALDLIFESKDSMRDSVEMMYLIFGYYLFTFYGDSKVKMLNKTDKSAK